MKTFQFHNLIPTVCFNILKLIKNFIKFEQGNHYLDGVCISDLNQHRILRRYFSDFCLGLDSISVFEKVVKGSPSHLHETHLAKNVCQLYFNL